MVGVNLGGPEVVIVLVVILLLFGGSQLPKLARSLGEAQRELRKGMKDANSESDDSTSST
ncbi:MAG: twin-arginine translocase TatA/TatE family subunit [Actinomycetota bacterium]|nr:twin-arginine translocase TatA/TatE family subunit [Actinomycetota bacterium]